MKYLLIILFLCGSAFAQTPIDYKKWHITGDRYGVRIGGCVENYQEIDSSWAEIDNNMVATDTGYTVKKAVLKIDIDNDGTSIITLNYKGNTYIVTQQLKKMIWINTDTWNWISVFDSVTWPTPLADSNIVSWNGVFPGINYKIRKENGSVAHGVFFKPAFLDSAIILYDQRADSADIAIGNVIQYTLTGVDNADIAIGNVSRRILKSFVKRTFQLGEQRVHFPGSDTLASVNVNQRWVKLGGKIYCIEYVMMSKIKKIHEAYPGATIWHNDNVTLDENDIIDSYGFTFAATTNYGTEASFKLCDCGNRKHGYMLFDVSGISGTIDSVMLHLNRVPNNVFQIYFAPLSSGAFVETEVTWNIYSTGNSWTTGGGDFDSCSATWCDSLDDEGAASFNEDLYLYDSSAGGTKFTKMVQDWLTVNNGMLIQTEWTSEMTINSTEVGAAARRPDLYVEFTTGAAGDISYTRRTRMTED